MRILAYHLWGTRTCVLHYKLSDRHTTESHCITGTETRILLKWNSYIDLLNFLYLDQKIMINLIVDKVNSVPVLMIDYDFISVATLYTRIQIQQKRKHIEVGYEMNNSSGSHINPA